LSVAASGRFVDHLRRAHTDECQNERC